ncbi:hypothetical protein COP2_025295 [Malus domestica]
MLVQEQGSGFLIMAVQHTHHLGERFGWQYDLVFVTPFARLAHWEGNNLMPPEFWANPSLLPFHPANILCYSRMTYLPMSYLFGKKICWPHYTPHSTTESRTLQ